MAFQAGSIFAEMELDTSPLVKGLKDASKAMTDFARGVESRIGPSVTRPFDVLRKSIARIRSTFSLLAKTAVRTFRIIAVAGRIVLTPFRLLQGFLTKSIFNLKNLIIVIAAAAFVRRAKQVESISTAFTNLSEGVGIVANDFLPALRESLKGTVSDLDIMRTTNNALLLGVVKSQEQFAELATVARRLGRAVGRDAVDALNDLAVGIGRQSRLILDNLGIIINVTKAYEDFAATLGLSADELTDNQKRQAFLNATMEQSRRKLKSLGPDVLTVADQWDRLTASINNTIDALATSLVGGNLPSAIADFIDENLQRIVASALAAEIAISRTLNDIIGLFREALASGEIARLLIELFSSFVRIVFAAITELVRLLVPVVITAVQEALDATDDILDEAARRRATERRRRLLVDSLARRQDPLLTPGALGGGRRGPVTGRDRLQAALSDSELQARRDRILDAFPDLAEPIDEQAAALDSALARLAKKFETEFKGIQDVIVGESKQTQKQILTDSEIIVGGFLAATNFVTSLIKRQFDVLGKSSPGRAFLITANDPIFNFRPIVTREIIQPIANAINFLAEFSRELGIRKADLFTVDQIIQGRRLIGLFGDATNEVNKLLNAIKKLTTKETIDPAKFAEILKPFTDQAKKLQLQIDTIGVSAKEATEATFRSVTAGQPPLDDELNQTQRLKDAIRLANSEKARLTLKQQLVNVTNQIRDVEAETLTIGLSLEEAAKVRADFLIKGADALSDQVREMLIALGIAQQQLKVETDILQAREELIESTTQIIGQGVTEGILQGKIAFKDVAEIGANLFRNFMSKAIDTIGKKLNDVLSSVLGSTGAVGLAGALIGIGGLIISNLQGKTESTIDDFGDQVTSSEAVRGVVAGPTNVAISKVGNQLKEALRVSEGLLLRIANAVESGGGGGGGGAGDTSDNLSVLLSGSTPS